MCRFLEKMDKLQQIGNKIFANKYAITTLAIISFWGLIDVWDETNCAKVLKFTTICFAQAVVIGIGIGSKNKIIRISSYFLFLSVIILSIISLLCYHFWHFGIGGRILIILNETTPKETISFLSATMSNMPNFLLSWHYWGMLLAIISASVILSRLHKKIVTLSLSCLGLLGLIGMAHHIITTKVGMGKGVGRKNISILIRTASDFYRTGLQLRYYNNLKNNAQIKTIDTETISSKNLANNIILIIGESSNKTHWSIYGYPLTTTPRLESMTDSIILFSDVTPPYGTTAAALPNVLTIKNSTSNKADWTEYGSIIGIANTIDYKTYWISNQGQIENIVNVIASEADEKEYIGQLYYIDYDRLYFDGEMLPIVDSIITNNNQNKLIAMHCNGSHFTYRYDYPPEFNQFSANDIAKIKHNLSQEKLQTIAEYDNAILYTDYVIASTINILKKDTTKNSLLIYVSDHSEDVYDTSADYAWHATKPYHQIHIPMIIWANEKYKQQNSEKWINLQLNKNKPYSSENIINTIFGLVGIGYSHYNPTHDLSSDKFNVQPRYFEEQKIME